MLGIYFCILILNLSGLLHFLKYTHFVYKSSKCYLRMINFTLHFLVLRILLKNSCLCHSKSKMEVSRRRCRQGAAQRQGSGRWHWKACELQAWLTGAIGHCTVPGHRMDQMPLSMGVGHCGSIQLGLCSLDLCVQWSGKLCMCLRGLPFPSHCVATTSAQELTFQQQRPLLRLVSSFHSPWTNPTPAALDSMTLPLIHTDTNLNQLPVP